ncbi:MAG: hypothetical protein QF714_06955 [Dehalococcoidia bacterium]|jgi:hypothetical protein|nr:hypothetical protein [Dehalococcoidia bacterium]MDP6227428.1 hypothetical protein [Dehalococcoidia bacterium]MDP7083021.1 hypothetical protein [Dehalococcoidia bacterium]MDP7200436.1 hypothetical protein [Dehalococcoidia bacterium]MDP7511241.1 hypothetical protein [Dehalococcoidia bacterium]
MGWFSILKIGKRKSRPDPPEDDSGEFEIELDATTADTPSPLVDEIGSIETAAGGSPSSGEPDLGGPPEDEPEDEDEDEDEETVTAGSDQEPPAAGSLASRTPNPNLPQMYKTWVELEETIGTARDGMESMLANRNMASASREVARETLEQAEAAWEEARRLGDVTWRAFDQGFTANLPGIAERLRTIKEVDEARRAQADLRWASQEAAWKEADGARQKATAGLLKAIASLAAAAVQVEGDEGIGQSVRLRRISQKIRIGGLDGRPSHTRRTGTFGAEGPGRIEERPPLGRSISGSENDAQAGRIKAGNPGGTRRSSPGGAGRFP